MLTLGLTGQIWICVEPQDGRKSFDGLQTVNRDHLARDPLSGDLFVLRNHLGDRLKILAWQGDGFALYMRRLERGNFAFAADTDEMSITATELAMILGGIELGSARRRPRHAPPILIAFADWLADQRLRVLPKSLIGEAVTYALNQWPTLGVYLTDGRLTIDNGPAEQAVRPLAIGRKNWLHLGGDGSLRTTEVLLSVTVSVKRHGINPWVYLKDVLAQLPARSPGAYIPERPASGRVRPVAGRADRGPGVTRYPLTAAEEPHGLVRPKGAESASDDSKNFQCGSPGKRPAWEGIGLRALPLPWTPTVARPLWTGMQWPHAAPLP